MKQFFRLLLILSLWQPLLSLNARSVERDGFAIVIDPESHSQARAEVDDYARALTEVQGLHVYVIDDRWGIPDSLRAELMGLSRLSEHPIAGAVLVGDIPVAMVRDAQHLTSAFKMSQRQPWPDSSVPSDRFYDDFSLQFDFLRRDSAQQHLFYYSLSPLGAQQLHPDLYTGRIRPTDAGGTSRYDKLRTYLRKASSAKRHPEPVRATLVYTGSGSLSESRVAHIDEMRSMYEHFPHLALQPDAFDYIDYSDRPYIKRRLMNAMMRPDLSIGLMHHHGDYDTQYLTSAPKPSGIAQSKEYLLRSLRHRLHTAERYGEDVDSIRKMLCSRYDLPTEWLADALSDSCRRLDAQLEDSLNLTLPDFDCYGYHPNCRVAQYDACYNGAFHNEDCIANRYIFQPGLTVAGIGGSVNVLQDKWPDHYLGLLAHGMMVGRLVQLCPELEMHVVGDPTYCFAAPEPWTDPTPRTLRRWLREGDADQQCLALRLLADDMTDADLLHWQQTALSGLVRLEAFLLQQQRNGETLIPAIQAACSDNFELLQRLGVNALQRSGAPQLSLTLARLIVRPNTSARVAFNAMQAVQFYPADSIRTAVEQALTEIAPSVTWPDTLRREILSEVDKYTGRWDKTIRRVTEGRMAENRLHRQADFMRIYLPAYLAPDVARFTANCTDSTLQIALLEALGWHRLAYTHQEVLEIVRRMSADTSLPLSVRNEARRTEKRISY